MSPPNIALILKMLVTMTIAEIAAVSDITKSTQAIMVNNVHVRVLKDFKITTVKHDLKFIKSLPESFDPRQKWPNCPSLNEIRDQGICGSCWAISSAAAMTDRICIYSNGTKNFHVSVEDVVTCSRDNGGCKGGSPEKVWKMWVNQGLVSGGGYGSREGCKPYSIPTSPDHVATEADFLPTPACKRSCNDGYDVTYEEDKSYGKTVYRIEGEGHIKAELFKNGPITAHMTVFKDLVNYKNGVYRRVSDDIFYEHVVKILGWGVDNGTKYWLVANSWNTRWGEGGFFRILRGVDECEIEKSWVGAGAPLLD